jgi:dienelactone hydrolase
LPLRKAFAHAGWRVHPWALGLNTGVKEDTLHKLEACVDSIGRKKPILLVGWSLGGLFARELARHAPHKVRAVVTLGSPFSGDLHQNNVWKLYEWVSGHKVEDSPIPRNTAKPPVPHLALWSRRDGIVAPRSAYGLEGERDEAVELDCSHMAFAVSRRAGDKVVREIDRFLKSHE